jgi:anti-sigma-K factor RskA
MRRVEEALQDVFVSIRQRAGQFQPQRGHAPARMMAVSLEPRGGSPTAQPTSTAVFVVPL